MLKWFPRLLNGKLGKTRLLSEAPLVHLLYMLLKRFRFHLSTAVVLMLLGAGANWYYVKHYMNVPEPWEVAIRKKLEQNTSISIKDDSFYTAAMTLSKFNSIISRKLHLDETPLTLDAQNLPLEEILNRLCENRGAQWKIQQGVLFFCLKDENIPTFKTYAGDKNWSHLRGTLDHKIFVCSGDKSSMADMVGQLQMQGHIRIVLDPAYQPNRGPTFLSMGMRLEHALNWACYFEDLDWSLRKGSDGKDEIYVTPKAPALLKADAK